MRLSKFTDYALRVCLYLAAHEGRLVPIWEISGAHGLSQSNLMKVVNQLVDHGVLQSTRGRSGGVRLAKCASEIRVGQVARKMEGDGAMIDCDKCILRGSCGVVRALREAKDAFYARSSTGSRCARLSRRTRVRWIFCCAPGLPARPDPGHRRLRLDTVRGSGRSQSRPARNWRCVSIAAFEVCVWRAEPVVPARVGGWP